MFKKIACLFSAVLIATTGSINYAEATINKTDKKVIDVPYFNQNNIASGCEAVSATMILRYLGYNITPKRFVDKYLIKKKLKILKNGKIYGPDPGSAYVGNPYISGGRNCGFGCYARCMSKCLNNYLKDDSIYETKPLTNTSLDYLIKNYIDKGYPVLLWATIGMISSKPTISWIIDYSDDGKKINKRFTWLANEHCLVLVGYDKEGYYFNDPYMNNGLKKYKKDVVEKRFKEMGKQAVVIEDVSYS